MTEKFINFQFLVPFPQFNLTIINENKQNAQQLGEMSTMKSHFRDLDFSTNFNKNDSFFNVDWLLQLLANERSAEQNRGLPQPEKRIIQWTAKTSVASKRLSHGIHWTLWRRSYLGRRQQLWISRHFWQIREKY